MNDKKAMRADIFRLIIPNALENILQVLAAVISTAMIGRLLTDEISAQGISMRIVQTIWAFVKGIGIGATVVVAIRYGAGKMASCRRIVEQTYATIVPVTIVISILVFLFPEPLLRLLSSDSDIVDIAVQYVRVCIWYLPFSAILICNTASFNGRGNTKTPMYIAFLLNIVNVAVGYVMIYGLGGFEGFGVYGAAIAIVTSQAVGAAAGLWVLYQPTNIYRAAKHGKRFFSFDKKYLREIYSIAIPAGFENMLWHLSAIILSNIILNYGSEYYAAYQMGLQAEMLTEMPAVGFVTAATTLSARAIGSRDSQMFKTYTRELLRMASIIAIFATAALFLLPNQFMMLMTDKPELQQIGALYVMLMGFAQFPQVLSKVYNGVTRSAGYTKVPMYISAIGIWGFRVPLVLIFGAFLKVDIMYIWMIIAADQILRLILAVGFFRKKNIINTVDMLIEKEAQHENT